MKLTITFHVAAALNALRAINRPVLIWITKVPSSIWFVSSGIIHPIWSENENTGKFDTFAAWAMAAAGDGGSGRWRQRAMAASVPAVAMAGALTAATERQRIHRWEKSRVRLSIIGIFFRPPPPPSRKVTMTGGKMLIWKPKPEIVRRNRSPSGANTRLRSVKTRIKPGNIHIPSWLRPAPGVLSFKQKPQIIDGCQTQPFRLHHQRRLEMIHLSWWADSIRSIHPLHPSAPSIHSALRLMTFPSDGSTRSVAAMKYITLRPARGSLTNDQTSSSVPLNASTTWYARYWFNISSCDPGEWRSLTCPPPAQRQRQRQRQLWAGERS